jgi:hypothetical protein
MDAIRNSKTMAGSQDAGRAIRAISIPQSCAWFLRFAPFVLRETMKE